MKKRNKELQHPKYQAIIISVDQRVPANFSYGSLVTEFSGVLRDAHPRGRLP